MLIARKSFKLGHNLLNILFDHSRCKHYEFYKLFHSYHFSVIPGDLVCAVAEKKEPVPRRNIPGKIGICGIFQRADYYVLAPEPDDLWAFISVFPQQNSRWRTGAGISQFPGYFVVNAVPEGEKVGVVLLNLEVAVQTFQY